MGGGPQPPISLRASSQRRVPDGRRGGKLMLGFGWPPFAEGQLEVLDEERIRLTFRSPLRSGQKELVLHPLALIPYLRRLRPRPSTDPSVQPEIRPRTPSETRRPPGRSDHMPRNQTEIRSFVLATSRRPPPRGRRTGREAKVRRGSRAGAEPRMARRGKPGGRAQVSWGEEHAAIRMVQSGKGFHHQRTGIGHRKIRSEKLAGPFLR